MLKELGLADAVIDQRVSEFEQQWDAYFPIYETSPPVVFADADFDATPAAIAQAERKLVDPRDLVDPEIIAAHRGLSILPEAAPLAGTVREAEAVMTALRKLGHSNAKLYSGVDALESVAREVQKPEILHFATHGFFLPLAATPQHARAHEPAAVALSVDDEQQRASSRRRSVFLEHLPAEFQPLDLIDHPYIRCGLLLAGSNSHDQWQQVRSADGILTALEVSMMDLRGTKLVVLSACETALGDPTIGEGVVSLRQAFQLAGARSVVASLWQVPDQQTADLMSEFFHGLQEHVAPAAALRAAQLKQLKSRRKEHGAAHPYLWAAFAVTGE